MQIKLLKAFDRALGPSLVRGFTFCKQKTLPDRYDLRRVLFIRPGGIGDAVLLLPVIRALKQARSFCDVDVLAEKRNANAFRLINGVRGIYQYDRFSDVLKLLNSEYDAVIDTEQSYRLSAVMSRLIKAPIKIGFDTNERKSLFTHPVHYALEDYEVDNFFHLIRPVVEAPDWFESKPFLTIAEEYRQTAQRQLGQLWNHDFVAIFPGASTPEKLWERQNFQHLISYINSQGLSVVIVGGKSEIEVGAQILENNEGINIAGVTSLPVTAAVIERSKLLVSGDSGVLHIGVGLGVKTVSLFGPSSVEKWAPRGMYHRVLHSGLSCAPCASFGHIPKCSLKNSCMQKISVRDVADAIGSLISTDINDNIRP